MDKTIKKKIKPEREVEIRLWDWLKTKGSTIEEVYFNSKNEINAPIFSVIGNQKKPDLILKIFSRGKINYYAVEVKDSIQSKNILRATKIITEYTQKYVLKETKYVINNKVIILDGFLIATQESLQGFLFRNEEIIDNWIDKDSKSKYAASKVYKIIPRFEGTRTFEFVRTLWEFYSHKRNNYEEKLSVGILIADRENQFLPTIMITYYNQIKKRWSQRWWKI